MSFLILLVEDNEQILRGNERLLRRAGYDVATALSLRAAREQLARQKPDAVILDIMLPDGSGLDLLREIRSPSFNSQLKNVPILLLTGLTTPEDVVRGLTEGGDDYLTKPYDFAVLLVRLEALLRRAERLPETLTKGALTLDIASMQAFCKGENLSLTQKDFALLLLFIQNENKPMSAEYLYEKVWNAPLNEDTQAIKSAVSRLRKKLPGSGYTVFTQRNEGYSFEIE